MLDKLLCIGANAPYSLLLSHVFPTPLISHDVTGISSALGSKDNYKKEQFVIHNLSTLKIYEKTT